MPHLTGSPTRAALRSSGSRARASRHLAALSAILLVAACGTSGPVGSPSSSASPSSTAGDTSPAATASGSPAQSVDPSTLYATIEQQVVTIRGLQPKATVAPKVLDDAGIKKLTADSFAKDNPPALVAANERILKAFGLLPADASLANLYVSLLGSQVAGLYSPDDKTLYVVSRSGVIGPAQKTTFAHEFTHALQDQNFNLGSLHLDEMGEGDRSFARLALVEGDATLSMSLWQAQHLSPAELGQLIAESTSDPSTAILFGMPPILRESLLFPYTQGLGFVQGLYGGASWSSVNGAFARPPASTEQILHPDKYASGEVPIPVSLRTDAAAVLGAGWKSALVDTFGEFQIGVWLRGNTGIDAKAAGDAAAGWGGDRIEVLDGPAGSWAVVLRTAWDSAADATAFEAAATPLVVGLASPGGLLPGAGGTERWVVIASDAATLRRVEGAFGLAG